MIDVDYAALCALHIKIRRLKELEDDVFHILADISGLGERGGVGNGKRHVEHLRKRLGKERFAAAGGTYEQNVALLQLNIRLAGLENALIVIVHGDGQRDLRPVLSYDILIKARLDLHGLRQVVKLERQSVVTVDARSCRHAALVDYTGAHAHALITYIAAVSGNKPVDRRLRLAAE